MQLEQNPVQSVECLVLTGRDSARTHQERCPPFRHRLMIYEQEYQMQSFHKKIVELNSNC